MKRAVIFLIYACVLPTFVWAQNVQSIRIKGQVGDAKIDTKANRIVVMVPYEMNGKLYALRSAEVEKITTENNAAHTLPDVVDLRNWTKFKVGNEEWQIKGGYQLPGSDFGTWHGESITGFITLGHTQCDDMPGSDKHKIWDCGNPAYAASGSSNWPTKKIKLADGSYAAELTTRSILGIIASGNLFVGRIERNMSLMQLMGFTSKDGKDLIQWGVPFEGRPTAIRVKFKYEGLTDSCTIMAVVENRSEGVRKYVGTAWYSATTDHDKSKEGVISISEPDKNGLRTLETKFVYGKAHANGDALPKGAQIGKGTEAITHVTVVFASSRRGDYFKGQKNARLIVKNFEFVY
ncbi:MAG: PCMD domain-containing protein [Bacteroidales bacterium]|jgi:hypothetical protein|nr:PCMD domain-containing protein [Bacteroidales bacterium]